MRINVRGGTVRETDPPLCLTCRFAKVAHGTSSRDSIVYCSQLESRVTFKVTSCSAYADCAHPSLWHMEDIAWILRTDAKRNRIGFVRAKDLPVKERLTIDEDI
jgi:hypothetical protein